MCNNEVPLELCTGMFSKGCIYVCIMYLIWLKFELNLFQFHNLCTEYALVNGNSLEGSDAPVGGLCEGRKTVTIHTGVVVCYSQALICVLIVLYVYIPVAMYCD